jgi:hypothetical protein
MLSAEIVRLRLASSPRPVTLPLTLQGGRTAVVNTDKQHADN